MATGRAKVYLPLEKLDECSICGKTSNLRLCSSCGEKIYCSAECQTNDWGAHKKTCGKTERVELASFYPFIAYLVEVSRVLPDAIPIHPALRHEILNDPNPYTSVYKFPDNSTAKLVVLGKEIPLTEIGSERWWPGAASPQIRSKLVRRMGREGNVLPILSAICISFLAEIYATTYVPKSDLNHELRRIRFQWHSSPLVDFGIAVGSVDIKPEDTFAYFDADKSTFTKGQDPNQHFWLYFTTLRGEEVIFDASLFSFNTCMLVQGKPYRIPGKGPEVEFLPAYVRDEKSLKEAPSIHKEIRRISGLRSAELAAAVCNLSDPNALRHVEAFMEKISGKSVTDLDRDLIPKFTGTNCQLLRETLGTRAWKKYPETPSVAIETDPGEMDESLPEGAKDWEKYMQKYDRKYELNVTALKNAFYEWQKESRA